MSELKAYIGPHPTDHTLTEYYLKSEADKVIAHHKHKRCLAMAWWCKRKRIDAANHIIPRQKWGFYHKWSKRWLALAEEPTWTKFLQLIHKEAK